MPGRLVSKPFSGEFELPERTKIISEIKKLRSSLPTEREFAFIEETSEGDAVRVREVSAVVLNRIAELERELEEKLRVSREHKGAARTISSIQKVEKQRMATMKWLQHEADAMDCLAQLRQMSTATILQKKAMREARAQEILHAREEQIQRKLSPLKQRINSWGSRMEAHEHRKESAFQQRSNELARSSNDRRSVLQNSAMERHRESQVESSIKEEELYMRLLNGGRNRLLFSRDRADRTTKFAQRYPVHVEEEQKKRHHHFLEKVSLSDAAVEASRCRKREMTHQFVESTKSANETRSTSAAERARRWYETQHQESESNWNAVLERFGSIRDREKEQRDHIALMRTLHSNELSFRGSGGVSPSGTIRSQTPNSFSQFSSGEDDAAKTSAVADRLISRIVKAAKSDSRLQSNCQTSQARAPSSESATEESTRGDASS